MRAVRVLGLMLVAGFVMTLAACASSGGANTGEAYTVPVEVDNNLSGLSGATIYVQRQTGTNRRLLGPAESGQKKTFQWDARDGSYVLVARLTGGQADIVSDVFQVQNGVVVSWNLAQNRLLSGSR